MCRILAGCVHAVMAADTVAKYVYVIKICRQPRACHVAVVAAVATAYVSRLLAGCRNTVVATNAIAKYAGVIEHSRTPRGRVVTIVALIA